MAFASSTYFASMLATFTMIVTKRTMGFLVRFIGSLPTVGIAAIASIDKEYQIGFHIF